MLLQLGDFQYVVRLGAKPKVWTWSVYHPAVENGDPVQQGEFRGSEGRAHVAAREAISRLREKRVLSEKRLLAKSSCEDRTWEVEHI